MVACLILLAAPRSGAVSVAVSYPPGPARVVVVSPGPLYRGGAAVLECRVLEPGRPPATQFEWEGGAGAGHTGPEWRLDSLSLAKHSSLSCWASNAAGAGARGGAELELLAPPTLLAGLPPTTGKY